MSTSNSTNTRIPSQPDFIAFLHPANDIPFLALAKNTPSSTAGVYGVCRTVALDACQIVAWNVEGVLSTSADPSDEDSYVGEDLVLTSDELYYHPKDTPEDGNYPICVDFATWRFPHDDFPAHWRRLTPHPRTVEHASNWTRQSQFIKSRDQGCLVSGWQDSLTTAHIVPKVHEFWMISNRMRAYSWDRDPTNATLNSGNLFTLRWDIHVAHFDTGNFVIVPAAEGMEIYFIGASSETANLYHLQSFDTTNISHEYLYARFAWAILKKVANIYDNLDASGRHVLDTACPTGDIEGEEEVEDKKGKGKASGGGRSATKEKRSLKPPQKPPPRPPGRKRALSEKQNEGMSTRVLSDMQTEDMLTSDGQESGWSEMEEIPATASDDPELAWSETEAYEKSTGEDKAQELAEGMQAYGEKSGSDDEAQELAEDIQTAKIAAKFFLEPNGVANPDAYEHMVWYPGSRIVERKKLEYIKAHPNISAHSQFCASCDFDRDDD